MRLFYGKRLPLLITVAISWFGWSHASAQRLPEAGTNGFTMFCEQVVGGSDFFTVIDTSQAAVAGPGGFLTPLLQVGLTANASQRVHRRALQVGRDPGIAVTTDGVSPAPIVGLLTNDGFTPYLEVIDFRQAWPPTPIAFSLGGGATSYTPYDIFVHPNGSFYVHSQASNPAPGLGLGITEQFTVTPGVPVTAGPSAQHFASASQYVTRMEVDPQSGNLMVPLFDRVEILTPALVTVTTVTTGATPGGALYQIGSNLAVSNDAFGLNTFCALRPPLAALTAPAATPLAGHSWLALNGRTGSSTFGSANPLGNAASGQAFVFAAGFHEPLVTQNPQGAVVTMLLDDPGAVPLLTGSGLAMQLQNTPTGLIELAAALPQAPFGNPEGSATSDAVILLSGANNDSVIAVGTGIASPIASVSAAVATTGFYGVNTIDRPLLLPGSNTVQVHYSAVAPFGSEQFTLGTNGAAPTLVAGVFFGSTGAPSSYANRLTGGLIGSLPIALQGFSGPAQSVLNDSIYATGFAVSHTDNNPLAAPPAPAIAIPNIAGIIFDPPLANAFGAQNARDAGFNYGLMNPNDGVFILPGQYFLAGALRSYLKLYSVTFPAGSNPAYYFPQIGTTISTDPLHY